MGKVNNTYANPTPLFKQREESLEMRIAYNKYKAIQNELYYHQEEVARLEEEYNKALKALADQRNLEIMVEKKALESRINPDDEYQNLIDNQMMHEDTQL